MSAGANTSSNRTLGANAENAGLQGNQLQEMLNSASMNSGQLLPGQGNKPVSNPMAEMRYGLQPKAEGQNEFQSQLMSRFGR